MFKLQFYGKKKLMLSFEYALVITDVAREQGIELTPELVQRAEKMIVSEFSTKTPMRLATDMLPNILSIFETNLSE